MEYFDEFMDSIIIFARSSNGTLYQSADGGRQWTSIRNELSRLSSSKDNTGKIRKIVPTSDVHGQNVSRK